jgi:hypothetical protein
LRHVLRPTIIGKAADLSGFLVILNVLFWGALLGVGAIAGVPITAAEQRRSSLSRCRPGSRGDRTRGAAVAAVPGRVHRPLPRRRDDRRVYFLAASK